LRLRNAVRLAIVENALEMFESAELEETGTKSRSTARGPRQKQPA